MKMNRRTERALRASIRHWERMKDDPECGEEPYSSDCPLCETFLDEDSKCGAECPVMKRGGCQSSPWVDAALVWEPLKETDEKLYEAGQDLEEARQTFEGVELDVKEVRKTWQKGATKEIKFLRSLLPKKPARKKK